MNCVQRNLLLIPFCTFLSSFSDHSIACQSPEYPRGRESDCTARPRVRAPELQHEPNPMKRSRCSSTESEVLAVSQHKNNPGGSFPSEVSHPETVFSRRLSTIFTTVLASSPSPSPFECLSPLLIPTGSRRHYPHPCFPQSSGLVIGSDMAASFWNDLTGFSSGNRLPNATGVNFSGRHGWMVKNGRSRRAEHRRGNIRCVCGTGVL